MDVPAPQPEPVGRFTVERYFALVAEGVLEPDDRVELLEGWWWRWRRTIRRTLRGWRG